MINIRSRRAPKATVFLACVCALLIAFGLLSGCAGKPAEGKPAEGKPQDKAPPRLSLEIEATADVNLGPGEQPLPVVVRVYALKGQGAFSGADFYSLFDKESEVLGADLVAREELTVRPAERRTIEFSLDEGVTSIGVVAAYRDIDRSRWRAAIPVVQGQDNTLRIVVAAEAISIHALSMSP